MEPEQLPAEIRAVLATEGLEEEAAQANATLSRIADALEAIAAIQFSDLRVNRDLREVAHKLQGYGFLRARPPEEGY